jgi:hypothetical protein
MGREDQILEFVGSKSWSTSCLGENGGQGIGIESWSGQLGSSGQNCGQQVVWEKTGVRESGLRVGWDNRGSGSRRRQGQGIGVESWSG